MILVRFFYSVKRFCTEQPRWAVFLSAVFSVVLFFLLPQEPHYDTQLSDGGEKSVINGDIIKGHAAVLDGDTIVVNKIRVRLHGIDAFEAEQSCHVHGDRDTNCGALATEHLTTLIGGQEVLCFIKGTDRYSRAIAVCQTDQVADLNAQMVHDGMALAYRQFSLDYAAIEDGARLARSGAWSGFFIEPWRVRKGEG